MANSYARLLGLPEDRPGFLQVFDGKEDLVNDLFATISSSKDPQVQSLKSSLIAEMDGKPVDDLPGLLANNIYGSPVAPSKIQGKKEPAPVAAPKSGIRGKTEGAETQIGDAPPATAAKTDPEVNASPAALAAAEKYGVDLSKVKGSGKGGRINQPDVLAARGRADAPAATPEATEAPAQAPPADTTAAAPDATRAEPDDDMEGVDPFGGMFTKPQDGQFVVGGTSMGMGERFGQTMGPRQDFQIDTSQGSMDASDPLGLGLPDLLAGQFANPDMPGAFPFSATNAPLPGMQPVGDMPGMQRAGPPTPPPDASAPQQGGMSIEDEIAALNALIAERGMSPPSLPSGPTNSMGFGQLQSLLDAQSGYGDMGAMMPQGGLQPNDFDYVAQPDATPGELSARDFDYVPSQYDGDPSSAPTGSSRKPPFQPVTSRVNEFMASRGLGGLNTGAITEPIDYAIRNAPWIVPTVAAGTAAYNYFNQPQQQQAVDPVPDDEADAIDQRYQQALQNLNSIQGPPIPAGAPPRRQ